MRWVLVALRDLTKLQLGPADIVDILAVAILIYGLLVLLKGSRAFQVLWGVLALVGIYLAARHFQLVTLATVLKNVLTLLPIAMIVIFSQEIRRMLSAVGALPLARLAQSPSGPVMVNELALAAQALSSKKLGALIAIQRSDPLDQWAETGIRLEAKLSYDLLMNIFVKGTPLHDGAVIVKGRTLVAASCFLPLSTNPNLPSDLGTRHRAAVGLSEETDALVIVVSEETGTISLAVAGQLLRPLDEGSLRNALIENLYGLGGEA